MDYETAKRLMLSNRVSDRLKIADAPEAPPEVLYYLAEDKDQDVRLAVAHNPNTPIHAAHILATDAKIEVREANAQKIARLLPNLDEDAKSIIAQLTLQTIETIVEDQISAVRIALSTALAEQAGTPPHIARKLAEDAERLVAEPILRYCAALTDEDLLEIIARHPITWRLAAIAQRPAVSESVSGAIIDVGDEVAAAALVRNEQARIARESFEKILNTSHSSYALQNALSLRRNLPEGVADRIEKFVERAVINVLEQTDEIDPITAFQVQETVTRRIKRANKPKKGENALAFAKRLMKEGKLLETEIGDALSMEDYDFVKAALAVCANTSVPMVDKMLEAISPKAIMALLWRARLSPRLGLQIQRSGLGKIPPRQLLYPKGADEHFPQTEDEMKWQLEFFGVTK